jgi:hypothetical protein
MSTIPALLASAVLIGATAAATAGTPAQAGGGCTLGPDLHHDTVQFATVDGVPSARTAVPIRFLNANAKPCGPLVGVHHSPWKAVPTGG